MELQIINLNLSFGKHSILKNITLRCCGGNIYGIVGYNGAGKSVLFKCIAGLLSYNSGEVRINGRILHTDMDIPDSIGIIIEEPGYLKNKSAYDNLEFLYCIRNKVNRSKVKETLERVGLNPIDRKKVGKFSLGMKQRLAIAQAIIEEPDLLILDEPMNGLDRSGIYEIRTLLQEEKKKGKLILLASHNKEDIDVLCDEVYEIENSLLRRIR